MHLSRFVTITSLLLASLCAPILAATDVSGTLTSNDILKDLSLLDPDTKVVLNGGQRSAYVEKDGAFTLYGVPDGSHLLEVISHQYQFDKIRLDVARDEVKASVTLLGTSWAVTGHLVPVPLELGARQKHEFFVPREGFNPMTLLQNPMMIMAVVSMGLVFLMPKMQPSEELQQEAAQQQEQSAVLGQQRRPQQQQDELPQMPDIAQTLANWFAPTQSGPHRK
ncbi:hypothetical protein HDV00_009127 [Rhizophlyctis rosea]|nr:hypothetical protein HDV00_009127 [Rhizophlyctis rosea]